MFGLSDAVEVSQMDCHQGKCAVALWGLCFKTGTVPEIAGTSRI